MRLALAALVIGCGGGTPRHAEIATAAPAAYPGVLQPPADLHPDFSVRQTLVIHAKDGAGKPVDAEIDAVLQKQGDTLLVVGFGPMNTKAFTLTQKADKITFDQYVGPQLPFSPRNIVVDIHRVYFMRLPPPTDPAFTGPIEGELNSEHVVETWQAGSLRGLVFTRPADPTLAGAIRIELGPGCTLAACEPKTATLRNEWFGYSIAIESDDYELL